MFKDVPIIGLRGAESLKDILVREKYLKLKTKVGVALVNDLDVKFANIFYTLGILHHLVKTYIRD